MAVSEYFKNTFPSGIPDLSGGILDDGRLRLIGPMGARGVVYLAETVSAPGTLYAVKFMSTSRAQLSDIDKEIRIHNFLSKITRRALKLHDCFEDSSKGLVFIVTEFCPGGNLLNLIASGTYFGKDELVKDTFVRILDAVQDCHRFGVYHRDLRPRNLLLKEDGKGIVLCNFGFSTMKKFTSNFHIGVDPYMSPEECRATHAELGTVSAPLSDIWALGVILMNLITGCLPWRKATINDLDFVKYLHDRDYLYRRFPISREANDIFKRIFTIDPVARTSIADLRKRVMAVKTFKSAKRLESDLPDVYSERYISSNDIGFDTVTDSDSLSSPPSVDFAEFDAVSDLVTDNSPPATGLSGDNYPAPQRPTSATSTIDPARDETLYQPTIAAADLASHELDNTDKFSHGACDLNADLEDPETRVVALDDVNKLADLDLRDGSPGREEITPSREATAPPLHYTTSRDQPEVLAGEPIPEHATVSVANSDTEKVLCSV